MGASLKTEPGDDLKTYNVNIDIYLYLHLHICTYALNERVFVYTGKCIAKVLR